MDEVIDIAGASAHQKGLELSCRMPPGFPEDAARRPGRLRQVLTNLVGNAIKFTENGEIAVECAQIAATATHVTLRLSRSGIRGSASPPTGSRPSFAASPRPTTARPGNYGGTGLGLAISAQLVRAHGRDHLSRERAGRGSTFRVDLTLERQLARGSKFCHCSPTGWPDSVCFVADHRAPPARSCGGSSSRSVAG